MHAKNAARKARRSFFRRLLPNPTVPLLPGRVVVHRGPVHFPKPHFSPCASFRLDVFFVSFAEYVPAVLACDEIKFVSVERLQSGL